MAGYDDGGAYEQDDEHKLAAGEADLWIKQLGIGRGASSTPTRVLDFGAGTGLLLRTFKGAGYQVTGLDASLGMIDAGPRLHADLVPEDFVHGDGSNAEQFAPATFDAIVSRQVLCHVTAPERLFANWHRWLSSQGRLLLVDGYWPPASWTSDQRSAQPFAALEDTEPLARQLRLSGFTVLTAGPFQALDALRKASFGHSRARYVVEAVRA